MFLVCRNSSSSSSNFYLNTVKNLVVKIINFVYCGNIGNGIF